MSNKSCKPKKVLSTEEKNKIKEIALGFPWENLPDEKSVEDNHGFIYVIENLRNGRKYIGCKQFWSNRKTKVVCRTKGKVVKVDGVSKKKSKRKLVEMDWKTYTGSSYEFNMDILNGDPIKRTILRIVPTAGLMAFYEMIEQLETKCFIKPEYYNGIINVRLGKNCFPKGFDYDIELRVTQV